MIVMHKLPFLRLLRFFLSILAGGLVAVMLRSQSAPEWDRKFLAIWRNVQSALPATKPADMSDMTWERLKIDDALNQQSELHRLDAASDGAESVPSNHIMEQYEVKEKAWEEGKKGFWATVVDEFSSGWKLAKKVPFIGLACIFEENRAWKNIISRVNYPDSAYPHGCYDPNYEADLRLLIQRENEQAITAERERRHKGMATTGKIVANTPTFFVETIGFSRLVSMLLALLASAVKWVFHRRAKATTILRKIATILGHAGTSLFRLICPERGP